MRVRRRAAIGSTVGALVLVVALATAAFASNGKPHATRVNVSDDATTTSVTPTTDDNSSTSAPTPTSIDTTTTLDTPTTPDTGSNGGTPTDGSAPLDTTTTTPPTPADLHYTLDSDQIIIQSGTTQTFSYSVTNTGDLPGEAEGDGCENEEIWPRQTPPGWPAPPDAIVHCLSLTIVEIAPHSTQTVSRTVVAGRRITGNVLIPAPPGTNVFGLGQGGPDVPVTITAPADLPFATTFPSHVTVASGAAHSETFTLTNRLAAAVDYSFQGPCVRLGGSTTECAVNDAGSPEQHWKNRIEVGANSTVTLTIDLSGTSDLMPPSAGNSALAPGTYHFEGPGGMPLTLTVTP